MHDSFIARGLFATCFVTSGTEQGGEPAGRVAFLSKIWHMACSSAGCRVAPSRPASAQPARQRPARCSRPLASQSTPAFAALRPPGRRRRRDARARGGPGPAHVQEQHRGDAAPGVQLVPGGAGAPRGRHGRAGPRRAAGRAPGQRVLCPAPLPCALRRCVVCSAPCFFIARAWPDGGPGSGAGCTRAAPREARGGAGRRATRHACRRPPPTPVPSGAGDYDRREAARGRAAPAGGRHDGAGGPQQGWRHQVGATFLNVDFLSLDSTCSAYGGEGLLACKGVVVRRAPPGPAGALERRSSRRAFQPAHMPSQRWSGFAILPEMQGAIQPTWMNQRWPPCSPAASTSSSGWACGTARSGSWQASRNMAPASTRSAPAGAPWGGCAGGRHALACPDCLRAALRGGAAGEWWPCQQACR